MSDKYPVGAQIEVTIKGTIADYPWTVPNEIAIGGLPGDRKIAFSPRFLDDLGAKVTTPVRLGEYITTVAELDALPVGSLVVSEWKGLIMLAITNRKNRDGEWDELDVARSTSVSGTNTAADLVSFTCDLLVVYIPEEGK